MFLGTINKPGGINMTQVYFTLNLYEGDKKYQASLAILDEGFEDAFPYLNESVVHSRLKSTNCLERLNEEIRRRERIIRIFPNVASAYPLIGAMLIDQDEE